MPVFYNQQVWGLLSMMTNYLKTMTTVTALEYTNRKITMNRTYNKKTYFAKTISVLFGTLALLLSFSQLAHAQGSVTTTYYHTDVLGSVIAASDEDGDVIWNRTYDSFGGEIISDSNGNELLDEQTYTGKPYDEETGLVYLGQRYYDPELRRFLSIDPVGFTPQNTESFNRYTYANNNPYKYVDPDGRQAVTPTVFRANRRGVSLEEAFQSGSRFRAVANVAGAIGVVGATTVGGGSVPFFLRTAAARFPNATIFGTDLLRSEVGFSAAGGGVLLAKGVDANTLQRTHSISGKRSSKLVDNISASMRKDGFVGDPIDVVQHKGQQFILDGHHRAAAARRTGTKVDVNVISDVAGHKSNFNSVKDVVKSAGSVGTDSIKPRRGR